MGEERGSFSLEFKRDAVARITNGGKSLTRVARAVGVHASLLQTRRRKLEAGGDSKGQSAPAGSLAEEKRHLRRENATLRHDEDGTPQSDLGKWRSCTCGVFDYIVT